MRHDTSLATSQLDNVSETLLMTLYIRALETCRPDALLKDEKAVAFVERMGPALDRIKRVSMDEADRATVILRNREIDRMARDFLAGHPQSTVVHLGCGLDSRFERVDDGRVEWYDLDLRSVIELRRGFIGGERPRYHLLAASAFDPAWFPAVVSRPPRSCLFLAEGVFQYFREAQIESLVTGLRLNFPGSELVFDAFSWFMVRANNLRMLLGRMGARYYWGLSDGQLLESWADGIRLLETWFPFDRPEPRLAKMDWARKVPFLTKPIGVYHYRLGDPPA